MATGMKKLHCVGSLNSIFCCGHVQLGTTLGGSLIDEDKLLVSTILHIKGIQQYIYTCVHV